MLALFKKLNYKVERLGSTVFLKEAGKEVIEILVDATDSRLMIKSMGEGVAKKGIKALVEYLGKKFGGKHIFCGVPESLQQHFIALGYTVDTQANPNTSRLRETFVNNLLNIKVEDYPDLTFIQDKAIQEISEENVASLMEQSGFLPKKIEQYKLQGYEGFQLMCNYSQPFGIKNALDELVAFCRVTDLGNGTFYLSDTFIDDREFEERSTGTAYLYQKVGEALGDPTSRVLLIVPPGREEEFDKNYACRPPQDVLVKFSPPQEELSQVFLEEKERLLATSPTLAQQPRV
jgi:hypothetical protein